MREVWQLLTLFSGITAVVCVLLTRMKESKNLVRISEFEVGHLCMAGRIFVAVINGDYSEMRRQYGGFITDQIE